MFFDVWIPSYRASSLAGIGILFAYDGCTLYFYVFPGAVVVQGVASLNPLHHVEAALHLTEHSVLVVQEGRAAYGCVCLRLLGGEGGLAHLAHPRLGLADEFVLQLLQALAVAVAPQLHDFRPVCPYKVVEDGLLLLHGELLLHLFQLLLVVFLPPDNVELAPAAFLLRIDLVTLPRRTQRASLVEVFGVDEFRGQCVARAAHAQVLPRRRALAVRVAALYHEVLDYPVEQGVVVEILFDELDEIVPVFGSLVIQPDGNVPLAGLYSDFCCHDDILFGILVVNARKGFAKVGKIIDSLHPGVPAAVRQRLSSRWATSAGVYGEITAMIYCTAGLREYIATRI